MKIDSSQLIVDTEPWEHLKPYGYAPGLYIGPCRSCSNQKMADKRAWRCRKCAQEAYTEQHLTGTNCNSSGI